MVYVLPLIYRISIVLVLKEDLIAISVRYLFTKSNGKIISPVKLRIKLVYRTCCSAINHNTEQPPSLSFNSLVAVVLVNRYKVTPFIYCVCEEVYFMKVLFHNLLYFTIAHTKYIHAILHFR